MLKGSRAPRFPTEKTENSGYLTGRSGTRLLAFGRYSSAAAAFLPLDESGWTSRVVDLIADAFLAALLRANHRECAGIDGLFESVESGEPHK